MAGLSLKLLSYNIHWGLSAFRRRRVEDRLVQTILREKSDIILLQELWLPEDAALRSLVQHLEEEWEHRIIGPTVRFARGAQGNGLLSRYPIRSWSNHPIPHRDFQHRALLHAAIQLPDARSIAVICTHFGLNREERLAQFEALSRYVASMPFDHPLVVGGDFNDWSCQLSPLMARDLGFEEVFMKRHGRHARSFPALLPLFCLDRIYTRNVTIRDARIVREAGWKGSSDHLPIAAEIIV